MSSPIPSSGLLIKDASIDPQAATSPHEFSLAVSTNDTSLTQRRCRHCAQPMTLIRRTQRFGGLTDLCTFECAACDFTLVEECKPTLRHTGEVYRKQAKACRELATQAQGDDRTFWLGLSDYWLKFAQVDDEQ
jgi:hypothetical protein